MQSHQLLQRISCFFILTTGKKISEIDHPPGSAIVALYEGKNLIIPGQEDTIKVGQKILILAKRDVAEKVRKIIQ